MNYKEGLVIQWNVFYFRSVTTESFVLYFHQIFPVFFIFQVSLIAMLYIFYIQMYFPTHTLSNF